MESGTKELIVDCVDDDFQGFVEVSSGQTLHDLRRLLADEFDSDMLPGDYYFTCNGVRYSSKQEGRKKLWDLIAQEASVRIHDRSRGAKRRGNDHHGGNAAASETTTATRFGPRDSSESSPAKKARVDSDSRDMLTEIETSQGDPSEASVEPQKRPSPAGKASRASTTPSGLAAAASAMGTPSRGRLDFGPSSDEEGGQSEGEAVGERESDRPPAADHDHETPVVSNKTSDRKRSNPDERRPVPSASSKRTALFGGSPGLSTIPESSSPAEEEAEPEEAGCAPEATDAATEAADGSPLPPAGQPERGVCASGSGAAKDGSSRPAGEAGVAREASSAPAATETNPAPAGNGNLKPPPTSTPTRSPSALSSMRSSPDVSSLNGGDDDDDDDDDVVAMGDDPPGEDAVDDMNAAQTEAMDKSCQVLGGLRAMLDENPLFCSKARRDDFGEEIRDQLASSAAPRVVVGVLGSTGVGKSSLLNALLDEAAVLPTSGSRGCTAAVVELSFNQDLVKPPAEAETIAVYRGKVEFIKPKDWEAELRVLVEECCTQEKIVYQHRPDPQASPDASAAWEKIDQVYGRGTMENYKSEPAHAVLGRLLKDRRVASILAPKEGEEYNSILVEEGRIEPSKASSLAGGFDKLNHRMKRSVKKWAHDFRRKINDYVYRKGSGNGPQTWPLIRCVALEGPWHVLGTGACLVDLPGVRDANAARARVAERYLQNCSQIWVVAPIKRAVDDGTAKELMGEQFKRRLLMDGQYGNISFICTQTDDCEATEIMRDHQDVASSKPGRWEEMALLQEKISGVDRELFELQQEEEDLKTDCDEAASLVADLKEAENEHDDDSISEAFPTEVRDGSDDQERAKLLEEASARAETARRELDVWRNKNAPRRGKLGRKSHRWHRQLKAICAEVRNEYSTSCLKEDFINGMKDLYRNEDGETEAERGQVPLPDDLELNVFCISANDYLKIQGIKATTDGPPNCFVAANDTQIPSLRAFVHETTAKHRSSFFELFANQVSDLVDRIKLIATEAGNGGTTRASRRCRNAFEAEMKALEQKVEPIVERFRRAAGGNVGSTLQPSLKVGASKGHASALQTVSSWGSKSRRTKQERRPDKNGLYWSTYQATIRRSGVYVSPSAGAIDLNQELCDPMEKEFSPAWQSIMDGSLRLLIAECETKIQSVCADIDRALVSGFAESGMDRSRLSALATTASRNCTTAIKASFTAIRQAASDSQRDLNRSLLPKIQERMSTGYGAAQSVQRGAGTFDRMKSAVYGHASDSVTGMFDDSISELLACIRQLIDRLASMISATSTVVRKSLEGVYSLCWEEPSEALSSQDPALVRKIQECRDGLLPELGRLRTLQDSAMDVLGIEREELELDVLHVDTVEHRHAKLLQQAIERGEVIDLCDSSDDDDAAGATAHLKPAAQPKVKAEPVGAPAKSNPVCNPDALHYLAHVRNELGEQSHIYKEFLDIMKIFQAKQIDTPGVIHRVLSLFRGNRRLLLGFNIFLPDEYRIELPAGDGPAVAVYRAPGSTLGIVLPPRQPSAQPPPPVRGVRGPGGWPPPPPAAHAAYPMDKSVHGQV